MKRIFIGIDISEEARGKIFDRIESLRAAFPNLRVGWERAEKLHLTLKFLGDVEDSQIEAVKKAVEKTARVISKFDVQIVGAGAFPNARRARILWLGLRDETGNLARVNEILESEMERIGFAREQRDFKPHLTIARLREPQASGALVNLHLETDFPAVAFAVERLTVFQSHLLPSGSHYVALDSQNFQQS